MDLPLIKEKNIQDKANRKYQTELMDLWKTTADTQVDKNNRIYSADVVRFEFKAPMGVQDILGRDGYTVTTDFYKDKLAKVYISDANMNFEEILTKKYGKPIKESKMKRVICKNGYGAKSSHREGWESSIWGKGKKITATYHHYVFDCGSGGGTLYFVEEGATVKIMDQIEKNGRDALEAEEEKIKAGASKL